MDSEPVETERLRPALGWNAGRYLKHVERMQNAGKRWLPGWNLAAFLHSTGWFWYRRMYAWSLLNLIAPVLLLLLMVFVVQWFVAEDHMGTILALAGSAYLALVYGLLPVYADSLYLYRFHREGKLPKPPSAFTVFGALLVIVIPATLAAIAAEAQNEYSHRERVTESLSAAVGLKTQVNEFYALRRRLPGALEAAQFHNDAPLKFAVAVIWDPARKAVVATMGKEEDGKRFELVADEKDGKLEWTCRSIDLEKNYLPASCR